MSPRLTASDNQSTPTKSIQKKNILQLASSAEYNSPIFEVNNLLINPTNEDDDDMFYEAREGPICKSEEEIDSRICTTHQADKSVHKSPKSFLKKLLSWGSSTKFPPNTPVQRTASDIMADRIVGEGERNIQERFSSEGFAPDYLISPPRDIAAVSEEDANGYSGSSVNRVLSWQDNENSKEGEVSLLCIWFPLLIFEEYISFILISFNVFYVRRLQQRP